MGTQTACIAMNLSELRIEPITRSTRDQYMDLCQFCFNMAEWQKDDYFSEDEALACSLAAFDGDRLAAGLWYWRFDMRVREAYVPMAGVAAVATWPEYRNQGIVRKLMMSLQEMMKNSGCPLSVLAPFKHDFYEQMGWAPTFDTFRLKFPPGNIKSLPDEGYAIREVKGIEHWETFEQLSSEYGTPYNGSTCRSEHYWRTRYFEVPHQIRHAYLVEKDGEPRGFIISRFINGETGTGPDPEVYSVRQAVWIDGGAQRAVFRFLRTMRDQVKFIRMDVPPDTGVIHLFDNPVFAMSRLEPKMMTKLIDIPAAIERIAFDPDLSGSTTLRIPEDSSAPWNVGTYMLTFNDGKASVSRVADDAPAILVSIQTLSDMFMGYRSVRELIYDGALAHPGDSLEMLDQAFPKHLTYIEDWF